MMFAAGRAVLMGLACLAFVGCAGAKWLKVEIEQGYQAPKAVKVAVVGSAQQREVVQALEEALVDELESEDVLVQIVEESSGKADVSVSIERWDEGSRATRYLVGFGAGEGDVIVSVASLGVDGTARGWVRGGMFGGDATKAAIAAGHLIGKTIATGLAYRRQPAADTP